MVGIAGGAPPQGLGSQTLGLLGEPLQFLVATPFEGLLIEGHDLAALALIDADRDLAAELVALPAGIHSMKQHFTDKDEARRAVWDRLQAEGFARFPFPPHGRIPNFAGARAAAARLLEVEPWRSARQIKVNPDAPQRPVREAALRRGITVLVPTPRLRAGFKKLDPGRIREDHIRAAASLSKGARFAEEVALTELPEVDAIVCGSVAVNRNGRRCGKGEGYSDLEYAILRCLMRLGLDRLVFGPTALKAARSASRAARSPATRPIRTLGAAGGC